MVYLYACWIVQVADTLVIVHDLSRSNIESEENFLDCLCSQGLPTTLHVAMVRPTVSFCCCLCVLISDVVILHTLICTYLDTLYCLAADDDIAANVNL